MHSHSASACDDTLAQLFSRLATVDGRGMSGWDLVQAQLTELMAFTSSPCGFIGDLVDTASGQWRLHSAGPLIWPNDPRQTPSTLWAAVLDTGGPVVNNQVDAQVIAGVQGLMALPLLRGGQLIGILGLSNRPGGYSELLAAQLTPALALVTGSLAAWQAEQRQREALTALVVARDTLRSTEEQYRQLFDAAGMGIARLALNGRFMDVNHRFTEITRHTREQLLQLNHRDITHPEDLTTDEALEASALEGQRQRYSLEKRYVRPGGQVVWVMLSVALVRDSRGQPLHFVAVSEDITERRQFEEAMTSAKAAERANKEKTDFLSRMSHELRTPLNAMLGFAQLLRVDPTNPINDIQRKKVSHIERAGAHLLAMLTDVLDLSRIEAGGLPLSLEPQRLSSVLEEAVALVSNQVTHSDVQLLLTPPADDLFVKADQVRLRQILVNLMSNAVKYNKPGGRVMIEAQGVRSYVVITVSDTGRGLSEEQQSHLFEPFNRLGAERTSVEGTGIGLVIVKRLIDLMRGRIEISSQVGIGSSFRVWLPAALNPQSQAADSAHGRLGARSGWGAFDALNPGALTLLYAEDNVVNVELVRQVMNMRPKWHLEVARNGAEAIQMARACPPDLLLLDMHLGDMSGLDVSDVLARRAETAGIPRVGLSADAMPDQISAARERGFLDYLTKPLDVARLLTLLDRYAEQLIAQGDEESANEG
ncbi:ATP-binding protein [Aquabacterium sp.]|uniref:ATP-binding protein n=1 Tax=Aquabacterium sp. TaxID=1872578 RepID=UPI0019A90D6B|nr:ATP-binding protein [Aquabacterium sp.]MBC7699914.1 PAS domain S-box protein [Aquabacterium sp.]